ncbi:MAG: ComEC/Rec2 family competence protein [Anaerolineales bacterium]|nr:ComEC/Rec2 family competence protein [Anaerolineales bacterium]
MTLVYLGFGWLIGLIGAICCPLKWPIWLTLGLFPIFAAFSQRDDRSIWRIYLAIGFAFLGAARYQAYHPNLELADYNGKGRASLVGYVAEEPVVKNGNARIVFQVEQIGLGDGIPHHIYGRVQVEASLYPEFHYGDRLSISGHLQTPTNESYRVYLSIQGITSIVRQPQIEQLAGRGGSRIKKGLMSFKGRAQTTLEQILPDPEASLLSGILLGNDQKISDSLLEKFNDTGATHVIAISGSNISLFIALLLTGLGRIVPRRTAGLLTLITITAYTILVGADPPVVRAAIMGGLLTVGRLFGRQPFGPTSLMTAAMVMTVANPLLIQDAGFQLSFVATFGLMLCPEPFQDDRKEGRKKHLDKPGRRIARLLGDYVLLTLAAQLATLPLIAYHFGRIPSISMLTNLLILCVQPLLMASGGIALLAGLVWLPPGQMAAWICYPFLWWTIRSVEWTYKLAGGAVESEITIGTMLMMYACLLGIVWLLHHHKKLEPLYRSISSRALVYASLISAAVCLTVGIGFMSSRPDGRLHVIFWDVGSGEAILIETPTGRRILVDSGPDSSVILDLLGRRMKLWDRNLELVIVTHDDYEHIGGMPAVLQTYQIGALLTNGLSGESDIWADLARQIEEYSILQTAVYRGQTIQMGDGVTLQVLNPDQRTAGSHDGNSIVLRIVYRNASFLLTGDINENLEAALLDSRQYLQSVVLKAANGGDKDGTSQPFLEAVDPWVVVFSVDNQQSNNQPARTVLDRLEKMDRPTARTDEMGSIHLTTDGQYLWMDADLR